MKVTALISLSLCFIFIIVEFQNCSPISFSKDNYSKPTPCLEVSTDLEILSDPEPAFIGSTVSFHLEQLIPDTGVTQIQWNYGDGSPSTNILTYSPNDTELSDTSHIYTTPQTYKVTAYLSKNGAANFCLSKSLIIIDPNAPPTLPVNPGTDAGCSSDYGKTCEKRLPGTVTVGGCETGYTCLAFYGYYKSATDCNTTKSQGWFEYKYENGSSWSHTCSINQVNGCPPIWDPATEDIHTRYHCANNQMVIGLSENIPENVCWNLENNEPFQGTGTKNLFKYVQGTDCSHTIPKTGPGIISCSGICQ